MASVIAAEPYSDFKDRLRIVNKFEREMHKLNYSYGIKFYGDCVFCYYDDREKIHNEN
jgi:hypothetical protein